MAGKCAPRSGETHPSLFPVLRDRCPAKLGWVAEAMGSAGQLSLSLQQLDASGKAPARHREGHGKVWGARRTRHRSAFGEGWKQLLPVRKMMGRRELEAGREDARCSQPCWLIQAESDSISSRKTFPLPGTKRGRGAARKTCLFFLAPRSSRRNAGPWRAARGAGPCTAAAHGVFQAAAGCRGTRGGCSSEYSKGVLIVWW